MLLVITVVRVYTVYSKNAQQIETEEIEINTRLFSHSFIIGCISTEGGGLWPGPQRENFPGGTKVDTGGPNDELIFNCPPAEGTLFIPCCKNITYETMFMT